CGGLGYGIFWYLQKYHSSYTATGYIQINPPQSFRIVDNGEHTVDVSGINLDQRTQAALLKDDALFGQVLQNGNSELRKTAWFQSLKTGTEAKDDLRSDFKAEVIAESRLVAAKFCSG